MLTSVSPERPPPSMPSCWMALTAQIHVRVGVRHFGQVRDVAAHHHALQHLLLDLDRRLLLIELPQLVARAHHAELADRFRSQLRRLLAGGRGEHALLVAGHHERAKDLSLDVDVRRRAVDVAEHLPVGRRCRACRDTESPCAADPDCCCPSRRRSSTCCARGEPLCARTKSARSFKRGDCVPCRIFSSSGTPCAGSICCRP